MRAEADIQRAIMLALSARDDCVIWRNNVGFDRENAVRYGLCKGSADLVGIVKPGIFVAIEVKSPIGKASPEQLRFLALVRSMGGRAGVARSVEDANGIVEGKEGDNG